MTPLPFPLPWVFDGKSQHATRHQHTRGFIEHGRQIGDIDHRIRRYNEFRAGI